MRTVIGLAHRIARDSEGATAIEYAFLAALLATAIVTSAMAIGTELTTTFFDVANSFPGGE